MPEQKIRDPYEILGVERTATAAAIQSAYRKLAKTHHPDVNPGKPAAEAKFIFWSCAPVLTREKEKEKDRDREHT